MLVNHQNGLCLQGGDVAGSLASAQACDGALSSQQWSYDPDTYIMKQQSTSLCLAWALVSDQYQVGLGSCTIGSHVQRWALEPYGSCVYQSGDCDGCGRQDCRWCNRFSQCLPKTSGRRRRAAPLSEQNCWVGCLEDRADYCGDDKDTCMNESYHLHILWMLVACAITVPCCLILWWCCASNRKSIKLCLCCIKRNSRVAPSEPIPVQLSPESSRSEARAIAQEGSAFDMRTFRNSLRPGPRIYRHRENVEPATGVPVVSVPAPPRIALESIPAIRNAWVAGSRRTERVEMSPQAREAKALAGIEGSAKSLAAGLKNFTIKSPDDGEQCPICIEEWVPSEVAKLLPCGHKFHQECIQGWLQKSTLCPICKADACPEK